tara:strand:- start:4058 stop:4732 length:675 start_codon:yes stop_codon:yes gene_type:complete
MKVDLISLSQPNISGIRTAEEFISYCARVSNPPNQLNTHTAGGLLRYCIKHNHFSIFEMVNLVFEIETSRDIGRQIIRHRSFSFQEFSQRYAEADEVPILRQTRLQDTKNKQNSIQTDDVVINQDFIKGQQDLWEHSQRLYKQALTSGIAKEQARALLPEGMTKTRMYMNGSLRSWIHYCQVRCGVETQLEHRDIAKEIAKNLIANFKFLDTMEWLDDDYSAES